jgi:hypothetical protein
VLELVEDLVRVSACNCAVAIGNVHDESVLEFSIYHEGNAPTEIAVVERADPMVASVVWVRLAIINDPVEGSPEPWQISRRKRS